VFERERESEEKARAGARGEVGEHRLAVQLLLSGTVRSASQYERASERGRGRQGDREQEKRDERE